MTIRHSATALFWPLPIMATALLLSSCTHPAPTPTPAPLAPPAASQLAQMGYGAQADFIHCVPPQCPVRTPKTLGTVPRPDALAASAPQAALPVEPTAPLPATAEVHSEPEGPLAVEQLIWSVPFAFGSAQLGAGGQAVMRQVIDELPRNARITIAGRTDSSGPTAVNDALALARAQAVRDHLVRARPELAPALTLDAQGSCCFTASNDTATGRARNRRVDILAEAVAPPP